MDIHTVTFIDYRKHPVPQFSRDCDDTSQLAALATGSVVLSLFLPSYYRVYNNELDLVQLSQGHTNLINAIAIIPERNQVSEALVSMYGFFCYCFCFCY